MDMYSTVTAQAVVRDMDMAIVMVVVMDVMEVTEAMEDMARTDAVVTMKQVWMKTEESSKTKRGKHVKGHLEIYNQQYKI